jgi:uncharacterized protein (DUF1697 family)
VALLRGVNVGRAAQLSMPALAEVARALGWTDVDTVLRSGNLLFRAAGSDDDLAAALSNAVASELQLKVAVVIRTGPAVRALVDQHPFADGDPARTVIACADRELEAPVVAKLEALRSGTEQLVVAGSDLFAAFPDGQASSRLAAGMARAAEPAVLTARNLNTMIRLADLLAS